MSQDGQVRLMAKGPGLYAVTSTTACEPSATISESASRVEPASSTPSVATNRAMHSIIGWRPSGKSSVSNATRNNVLEGAMFGSSYGRKYS